MQHTSVADFIIDVIHSAMEAEPTSDAKNIDWITQQWTEHEGQRSLQSPNSSLEAPVPLPPVPRELSIQVTCKLHSECWLSLDDAVSLNGICGEISQC